MNPKILINALGDDGIYNPKDRPDFLVFGNPLNPEKLLIFEKACAFESALLSGAKNLSDNILVCTLGNPSEECLKFISKFKSKKILWLADLDPTSIFNYLSIKNLSTFPNPTDKPNLKISFAGLCHNDCLQNLDPRRISIRLSDKELFVLEYVKKFKVPELKKEIKFLEKGRKFEIEGFIGLHKDGKEGFKKYLEKLLA